MKLLFWVSPFTGKRILGALIFDKSTIRKYPIKMLLRQGRF